MKQLLIGDSEAGISFAAAHRDGVEYVAVERLDSDKAKAFDKEHDSITVSLLDADEVRLVHDWLRGWLSIND